MYFRGRKRLLKEGCPWPNSASGKFNLISEVSADVEVYGKHNFMGRLPVQLPMAPLRRAFHLIKSCCYHLEILSF